MKAVDSSTRACERRTLASTSLWALIAIGVAASGSLGNPVLAASPEVNDLGTQKAQAAPSPSSVSPSSQTGAAQTVPPTAAPGITPYTIPPPPAQNPYALADQLKVRGWLIFLPGAADTFDEGLFGVRNALAENGISYLGFSTTTFQTNVLKHELPGPDPISKHSRHLQQYNGQLPTYNSSNVLFINFDLQRFGIPDGQITVGGYNVSTNWNPTIPNGTGLAVASYYQTLFDRRVELKFGLLSNNLEFLGTQVGGNLASGVFGVNAAIGVENGENLQTLPTLGGNVKVNFANNFYTKVGVQRAISPDGVLIERRQNPIGVALSVPNAGVFAIDETGYRVNAAPGEMSTWIRAAASVTSSRYNDFAVPGQRRDGNFGLYFLADRQLLQTAPNAGPGSAARGIYVGASVMYTPSELNAFSQYYEGRIYGFGLIPGRPADQISFVVNRNVFSQDAVRGVRRRGLLAHDDATTYTAAYSAHVAPGVNLNVGLSYIDHPTPITYTRNTGSALNALVNLFIFL